MLRLTCRKPFNAQPSRLLYHQPFRSFLPTSKRGTRGDLKRPALGVWLHRLKR